jgi:hypothetical protein
MGEKKLLNKAEMLNFAEQNSNEQYHGDKTRISKSGLDLIDQSPEHFRYFQENPREATPAMQFGTAVHTAILEPDKFDTEILTMPRECKGNSKAAREAKEIFLIENAGKTILDADKRSQVKEIRDKVYSHAKAKAYLSEGHAELSYYWQDPDFKTDCKCRPDMTREGHILVDIKTTEDASLKSFQKSIANFRYHVQAAFYTDGLTQVTGQKFDKFVFIVVEKKPPYGIAIYAIDDASMDAGRFEYKRNLKTYLKCKMTKSWPGYPETLQPINLPSWAWPVEGE